MHTASYTQRRDEIETYFDRTAMAAWAKLTSNAPVSRIRATVRAGREAMRETLLSWLPADMHGARLLDAGCGTGALALAAAERGAKVVAVDLSPQLIALARERAGAANIRFLSGDMLNADLGRFDYVVAMDSLIHYRGPDVVAALSALSPRVNNAILFTFAPSTPMLATMHAMGQFFPKRDRSPAIEPQREAALRAELAAALTGFRADRTTRIATGFYISQALELIR
jgi:magnesium-protoporphyrin O-methyltransferase